jgi:hypothetical protein
MKRQRWLATIPIPIKVPRMRAVPAYVRLHWAPYKAAC